MPDTFLTRAQRDAYGKYNGDPTPQQLYNYFRLTPKDLAVIANLRRDHTRLGFAIQLCTLKFLGTFLEHPVDVPAIVVRTLARQLGLKHTSVLSQYLDRRPTRFEHQAQIRKHLQYREFQGYEVVRLARLLLARHLISDDKPAQLLDFATQHLTRRHMVLPGVTTLERLVQKVRQRNATALSRKLSARLNNQQAQSLEDLLIVPDGQKLTPLERMRAAPTRVTAPGLLGALDRLHTIRALGVSRIDLSDLPASRIAVLARQGLTLFAFSIANFGRDRRLATLLAFTQHLERRATDDALELFEALMQQQGLSVARKRTNERLRTLKDLDAAALLLRDAARLILDRSVPDGQLRTAVFKLIDEGKLAEAVGSVSELASNADDEESETWLHAATTVGRFLIPLAATIEFDGVDRDQPILDALRFLTKADGAKRRNWNKAPRTFVPASWKASVFPGDDVNRRAYVLCAARQLHLALKRRSIFAPKSLRFGDPRAQLLQGAEWDAVKDDVARDLG
ncbi:DUF4158 domain-containing protein [Deinococcus peraridilitoris]|uniref:DUF4158 domain-containing protein n=1 Tax=Deinococcus peraridilitoris TaxID=432329 RepID=UPI0002E983D5|nr:DUF4158 domain-containing protein [Deinococcus peraridilitoris]